MKDIHKLSRLGVRLVDFTIGGVSVHPSSKSSLVDEVKEGHHLDLVLMELKYSVLVKMNESFALGDDDIRRYRTGYVYQIWMIWYQDCCRGPRFQIFHTSKFHQDVS